MPSLVKPLRFLEPRLFRNVAEDATAEAADMAHASAGHRSGADSKTARQASKRSATESRPKYVNVSENQR